MKAGAAALLSLLLVSLAAAGPVAQERASREEADEVQQLDQLRKAAGEKGVSVVKTQQAHFINVNGKLEGHTAKQETVKDASSDATLASAKQATEIHQEGPGSKPHGVTRTQVDVPSLGIHESRVEDAQIPYRQMMAEKKNLNLGYPWIGEEPERPEYTPADLAEYIMRTGDEEGVAMAVEELLRQGAMGREEAILYLQDVKAELNYLRSQQEKLRRIQELREAISMKKNDDAIYKQAQQRLSRLRESAGKGDVPVEKGTSVAKATTTTQKGTMAVVSTKASTTVAPSQQSPQKPSGQPSPKSSAEKRIRMPLRLAPGDIERLTEDRMPPPSQQEAEVIAMLQKLKGATSPYDKYTLEEVIYWLAKDMLAHSILRGDQSAEEALARFATFVESEVAQNKISSEVQKKVLDIMLAALVDILRETSSNQYSVAENQISQVPFALHGSRVLIKPPAPELRNTAIRPIQETKKSEQTKEHASGATSAAQKS